jgi:hypothetical protein
MRKAPEGEPGTVDRRVEIFGLSPEEIDDSQPVLHIRRQIKIVYGRLIVAAPVPLFRSWMPGRRATNP